MSATPPEITLELNGGSLTIRTAEAIYRIVVTAAAGMVAAPVAAALPAAPQPQALPAAPPPAAALDDDWGEPAALPAQPAGPPRADGAPGEEEYYRELSHDMFREVGRLARRLSMSIRDVKIDKVDDFDLATAGQRLEQAKDQLENVVKMTEQATLHIMDMGEAIQGAIDRARGIMERMSVPPDDVQPVSDDHENARQALAQALESMQAYVAGLDEAALGPWLEKAQDIVARLEEAGQAPAPAAPEPEPEPEPEPAGPAYLFPLEVVFQTVYELCTNETVKKHIKAMWDAGPQAFDPAKVEQELNALVGSGPDQDNFLNLDLKGVLKTLYQASNQDRFQQVLKKMGSTADQIFLEQTLPLEAMPAPASAAPAPKPAPKPQPAPVAPAAPALDPALLEELRGLVGELETQAAKLVPPVLPASLTELWHQVEECRLSEASNVVEPQLITDLEETMGVILTSSNSIIEALSFQDLSGQTIYRIVRLLTDFQVQLLAMVVSFGSKLKSRETKETMTTDESDRLAQQEVDKVMEKLGVHETPEGQAEDGSKLDQDEVNSLLANLGF